MSRPTTSCPPRRHPAPRSPFLVAAAIAALFATASVASAEEVRTWTDSSGQFKVEAEFVEVADGRARIKTPDGKVMSLPLAKLSKKDQRYLRALMKERKLEEQGATAGGSFGGRGSGGALTGGGGRELPAAMTRDVPPAMAPGRAKFEQLGAPPKPGEVSPCDLTDMRAVPPASSTATQMAATLATPAGPKGWSPRGVVLTAGYDDRLQSLHATPAAPWIVCLGYAGSFRNPVSRIELVDVAAGKHLGNLTAPDFLAWARISPSGQRVMTNSTVDGHENPHVLDVWDIDGDKLKHVVSWQPYSDHEGWDLEPQLAEWVDDGHVITKNRDGKVRCWQLDGAKALWELVLEWNEPRLSPDRTKLISQPMRGGAQVLDARSGEWLGSVAAGGNVPGGMRRGGFAVSPSGAQLAVAGNSTMTVVNLLKNEPGLAFGVPKGARTPLRWVDERFLLANDVLIDTRTKVPVWRYRLHGKTCEIGNVVWTHASSGRATALMPAPIPHGPALAAAEAIDPDTALAAQPGDKVSIDVQLGDANLAAEVRAKLAAAAEAAGFVVSDGAPLRLTARTTAGESSTRTYEIRNGLERRQETVTITAQNHTVALQREGRELWQTARTTSNDPGSIIHTRGDSLQSEVNKHSGPSADLFNVQLPSYIAAPAAGESLPSSNFSNGKWVTSP